MTISGRSIRGGRGDIPSVNPASWFSLAIALMGIAASGCTSTSNKSRLGETANSGFAITSPKLQQCDELACHYSPIKHYYVRDIRCPEASAAPVICEYERAETDSPFPEISLDTKPGLGVARPGKREVQLVWEKARGTLSRSQGGTWRIAAESGD